MIHKRESGTGRAASAAPRRASHLVIVEPRRHDTCTTVCTCNVCVCVCTETVREHCARACALPLCTPERAPVTLSLLCICSLFSTGIRLPNNVSANSGAYRNNLYLYRVIVNECYKNKQVTCNKYQQFFVVTCLDLLSMSGHLLLIPF